MKTLYTQHFSQQPQRYKIMTTPTIKTTTDALLDAWYEFNYNIDNRSSNKIFTDDHARVELFKMLIDIETSRAYQKLEVL